MRNEANFVHGSVKIITCQSCSSRMALFAFDAETNMDSIGLCSATRCNELCVVIAETTLSEWKMMESGKLVNLPSRITDSSGMKDSHVLHIKRIERAPEPAAGVPFSEFKRLYGSPVAIYSCPCCDAGEAIETQDYSLSEFEAYTRFPGAGLAGPRDSRTGVAGSRIGAESHVLLVAQVAAYQEAIPAAVTRLIA